jgi:hypothetical protein
MSQYGEPVLPGGQQQMDQGAATAPARGVVAPSRVTPKPLGRWGVWAWVWELRDQQAKPAEQIAQPAEDRAVIILPEFADEKDVLLGQR